MIRRLCAFLLLSSLAPSAQAAVSLDFYSREMGNYFPHAFIVVSGHPDNDPRPVDTTWGFTATKVSPALLTGAVVGAVEPIPPAYITGSVRHFTVVITDAQWASVRALEQQWATLQQPSYDLHKRNCVSFAAAIANQVGLRVAPPGKLVTKPHQFLDKLRLDNPVLGDGAIPVTALRIAQANGGALPAGRTPVAVATSAPVTARAPAATPPAGTALSAAAIAAGYTPN